MEEVDFLLKNFGIDRTNPDWQIEEFWLTFKNQFYWLLDIEEKKRVDKISEELNDLQRNKRYEQIQQYIVDQFDSIAIRVIISRDKGINHSILSYFNRWDRISKYKFDKKNINYQLLKVNDILNYKSKTKDDEIFQELIYKYVYNLDKRVVIDEMVIHCIKSKQWHHLERIRSGIPDIKKYFKTDTPEKLIKNSKTCSIVKLKNYFI